MSAAVSAGRNGRVFNTLKKRAPRRAHAQWAAAALTFFFFFFPFETRKKNMGGGGKPFFLLNIFCTTECVVFWCIVNAPFYSLLFGYIKHRLKKYFRIKISCLIKGRSMWLLLLMVGGAAMAP